MTIPQTLQNESAAAVDDGPANDLVVDVRDVHYSIGTRSIFSGMDITARRGRITAIMGPSGTG
ncbi:MAG: ABC transporter ATP-binding protein, partial [Gammaproteobacteria bacterium]